MNRYLTHVVSAGSGRTGFRLRQGLRFPARLEACDGIRDVVTVELRQGGRVEKKSASLVLRC